MANHTCQKCGKTMDEKQFFTYRDGSKTELCKKCLTMHVDNFDESTYLWILEKMDVPYVPEEWNVLRDRAYAKDPFKMDGMSVLGKYLSKMKLTQWKKYHWADGEEIRRINKEKAKAAEEAQKIYEQEVMERFKAGEISEAEYRTLMSTETQMNTEKRPVPTQPVLGSDNYFDEKNFMSEEELVDPSAELTNEDKIYLAMKWGRLYRPNEWVELETKYNEMMNSFDIQDSDTIGTLILICKTYLKMNQAIDHGDMDGFQKLSRVYDSLRKSAKLTAAQNKEQNGDFIDSIGEMVAYCEKNGGQIPSFDISTPRDIIDTVIKDLKDYNKTLIYEDKSLATQIEDYLKKKQISEERKKDKEEAKKQGLEQRELTNEDYEDYYNSISDNQEKDYQIYNGEVDTDESTEFIRTI